MEHREVSMPGAEKGKIAKRLVLIGKILIIVFAAVGIISTVSTVKAFFDGGGLEPIESISVEDIVMILVDQDGDTNFEFQVTVENMAALMDIESGQVFLSVTGSTSNSGQ